MRTLAPRLAATVTVLALLVSGCGGGNPEPAPAPKPTKSTSPSASPSAPAMPEAAKAKTREGAARFVNHFVATLNYGGVSGDTAPLRALSLPTCVKCQALANGIDDVYSGGGRIIGGGWTVRGVRHYGFTQGHYFLDLTIDSAPQEMVPRAGEPAQRFPGAEGRLRALVLERSGSGWKVSELDPEA